MRARTLIATTAICLTMAMTHGVLTSSADEPLKTPEQELVIEGKKPARFNHTTHLNMGLDCGACHHDADHQPLTAETIAAMTDPAELSCVSCHNSEHPNKKMQKAKSVFHARCKDCHKAGHEGKTGPTKCNDCHIKKAK